MITLLLLLVLAQENTFRGFITYNKSEAAGFEEGYGILIDGKFQITPHLRFRGLTDLTTEKKFNANDGFAFGTSLGLGLSLFKSIEPFIGVSFGGYNSRFNSDDWQKVGLSPEIGLTYYGKKPYEINFVYSFDRDDQFSSEASTITGIFDYPSGFSFISSFTYFNLSSEFNEDVNGNTAKIGMGYKF